MTAVGTSTAGDGVARLLLRYVLLTYGISWLLGSLALGVGGAAGWVLAVAGTFGPAAAAGLVVRRSGGSLRWPGRTWLLHAAAHVEDCAQ
jgi:hypothetical protein